MWISNFIIIINIKIYNMYIIEKNRPSLGPILKFIRLGVVRAGVNCCL